VRVLERGGGLDLLDEPVGAEHGGELGLEDLDGDLAVVAGVVREIDRGHAALTQLARDAVAVGEACPEALDRHEANSETEGAEGAADRRDRRGEFTVPPGTIRSGQAESNPPSARMKES
jgi:hypothetical protein